MTKVLERKITLVEPEGEIISDDQKVAETLNAHFKNAISSLNLRENANLGATSSDDVVDSIDKIIEDLKNHPSILKIKEKVNPSKFDFKNVSSEEIEKLIKQLDPTKASTSHDIPVKLLKDNIEVCSDSLKNFINHSICTCSFPDKLKLAEVCPIHKKDEATKKDNYRNISVLPAVSKIYERVIANQMYDYINKYLSPHICGYRRGYGAKFALCSLIECWRK